MRRKKHCMLTIAFVIILVGLLCGVKICAENKTKSVVNKSQNSNSSFFSKNYESKTENFQSIENIDVYVPSAPNNAEGSMVKPTLEEACQYLKENEESGIIHVTEDIEVDQMTLNKNIKVIIKSDEEAKTITKNGSNSNMFAVTNGGSLTLENIIVDATNNDEGRTIVLESESTLSINENAVVENNDSYGAIYAESSSVIVNGGTIRNNHTTNGININEAKDRPNSEDFEGGAILYRQNASFEMNGGNISNNSARSGGAIYGVNPKNMIINCGTFEGNKTINQDSQDQFGGVIGFWNADNCEISVTGETVFSNNSSQHGGVLYINGKNSTIDISGGEFTNNVVTKYGGIFNCQCSDSKITLSECNFKDTIGAAGGVIYAKSSTSIEIIHCTFENNTAQAGGAIIHQGSDYKMSIKDSTFKGNKATALVGGAIHIEGKCELALENCTFDGNTAKNASGAISFLQNDTQESSFFADRCTFKNNETITGEGGAIHTTHVKNISFNNCEFIENKAMNAGGGLDIYNTKVKSELTLDNCTFKNNETLTGAGGAVHTIDIKNVNLNNCEFIGNTAETNGGGFDIYNNTQEYFLVNINGGKFTNNTTKVDGGGLMVTARNADIIVEGGTQFSENTVSGNGGGMWIGRFGKETGANINLTLAECDIINNVSLGDPSTYQAGNPDDEYGAVTLEHYNTGGIYIGEDVRLYMNNALVTGNSVEGGYNGNVIANGVGLCPNAEAYFYENSNISIYNNGTNDGMDILAVPYDPYVNQEGLPRLYIADKMTDGKEYNWTNLKEDVARTGWYNWDKALEEKATETGDGEEEALASTKTKNRITNLDGQTELGEGEANLNPVGFKAHVEGSEIRAMAEEDDGYKVHITGNTSKNATYGAGGLMINGSLIGGNFNINVIKNIGFQGVVSEKKKQEIINKDFEFKLAIKEATSDFKVPTTTGQQLTKTDLEDRSPQKETIVWNKNEEEHSIGFAFNLKGNQKLQTDEINKEEIGIVDGRDYNFTLEETESNGANEVNIDAISIDAGEDGSTEEFVFTCTNTFKFGGLNITKIVEDGGNKDKQFTFNIEVENAEGEYYAEVWENGGKVEERQISFTSGKATTQLKHGQTLKIMDLPIDAHYTVSEEDTGYYTVSSTSETGTISDEPIPETVFTNKIITGGINVSKTVTGDGGDTNKDWHFTVTLSDTTINGTFGDMTFTNGVAEFTLKHGESKQATGIPENVTYTVTETEANQDGYTTSSEGTDGTISSVQNSNATFTNSKTIKRGNLKVSKIVTGDGGDTNKDWHFTVTLSDTTINGTFGDMTFTNGVAEFTLKHGESKQATGIPENVTYTVTETEANQDGYTTSSEGTDGTISSVQNSNATFTNSKTIKRGNLKVSKTVVSEKQEDKEQQFNFKVTLSDTTINGEYGEMTFENGIATFTLKDGEEKTASGLPTDIEYTVTEENNEDYEITSSNETGTIVDDEVIQASFVNKKKAKDNVQVNPPFKKPGNKDNTITENKVLPYAGVWNIILAIVIIVNLIIIILLYTRYKKYSDIK